MRPHRVTDLRHLLDTAGQPAHSARSLAFTLGAIVECVTAMGEHARWVPIPVGCFECEAGRGTPLAVRMVGPGIEWLCGACRASGTITGFRGSRFDLSECEDTLADDTDAVVFTRLAELDTVRKLVNASSLRMALAHAVLVQEHVVLALTRAELSELIAELERGVSGLGGSARHAAERFAGRCDAVLLMLDSRAREEPPLMH